jgi:3'(2'), 5'-bisphosphate nucleotidase
MRPETTSAMDLNLEVALKAALEAGKAILEIYNSGNFDVTIKGDDSPLTRADLASHEVIVSHLEPTNIPILSEEGRGIPFSERRDWEQLWIVDPIDGTKEFIKRNGEFTVNIALVQKGLPVLGVIFVPATGELYYADQKSGAFKLEKVVTMEDVVRDRSTAQKLPLDPGRRPFTVVASRSHMSIETEEYVEKMRQEHGEVALISKGSSLKLCMVAEGKADCYPRFAPTMEWDTAAGQAICMSANFDVLDWETQSTMRYNRENLLNSWFLVH